MADPTSLQQWQPSEEDPRQAALRAELVRLVSLLDSPLALVDAANVVLAWNDAAERLTGIGAPEVTDLPIELALGRLRLPHRPRDAFRLVGADTGDSRREPTSRQDESFRPLAAHCIGIGYPVGPFTVVEIRRSDDCDKNQPGPTARRLAELDQFLGDTARQRGDGRRPLGQPVLAVPLRSGVPANMVVELGTVEELELFARYYRSAPLLLAPRPRGQELLQQVARVASTDVPVAVVGESGTGKRLVARLLHLWSLRAAQPIEVVYLGPSLADRLTEVPSEPVDVGQDDELVDTLVRAVHACRRGTIVLHRAEMFPHRWLAWLVRSYEEAHWGNARASGGFPNVRLITTMGSEPRTTVSGDFRQLLATLALVRIEVPSLREWPELIEPLTWYFVSRFNQKYRADVRGVEPAVFDALRSRSWPGNARELRNVISRACAQATEGTLTAELVLAAIEPGRAQPLDERARLIEALERAGGNRRQAARLLGISPSTLYRRMRRYGIASRQVSAD